jgi:hypothetical protein
VILNTIPIFDEYLNQNEKKFYKLLSNRVFANAQDRVITVPFIGLG